MEEIWKPIRGYETRYSVSNFGRVRRIGGRKPGYVLKPLLYRNYFHAALWDNGGKAKFKTIHRIVAQTFIPNPRKKPQVNHRDSNKLNNHFENLEWVTIKENAHHAFLNGRYDHMIGTNNMNAKLTPKDVREIRRLKGFVTQKELSKRFGIASRNIIAVQKRRVWKQVI